VDGNPLECALAADGGDETHVIIDLAPGSPAIAPGKPLRLARARYDGVLALPAAALAAGSNKGTDHRVFVAKDGRAESFVVVVADQDEKEVLVTQGLDPGSTVILEPPASLRAGARVQLESGP
jgi:multidrug efflux pump subunit AcrA (membrane-fusion protein)